jgi:hypothetical protein
MSAETTIQVKKKQSMLAEQKRFQASVQKAEDEDSEEFESGMESIETGKRNPLYIRGLDSTYSNYGYKDYQSRTGPLSYALLREIYVRSSYVRPCVDALVRSVSSCPWVVRPFPGGSKSHADTVRNFLKDPNSNDESLRSILAQVLTDIMVIDEGVIEKVKSFSGTTLELFARDGATFFPIKDEHGILHGYVQDAPPHEKILFTKDEIIYFELFPTTWNSYGLPIIETIVNEVAALMFSVQWIADSFTMDKIPPGILVLGKVGKLAYARAKEEFQGGEEGKFTVKMFRNVGDAKWIELKKTNSEMQLAELNTKIENIVYRAFGLQPFELGVTHEINRATAQMALRVSQTRIYKPLIQMMGFYLNQNLIQPIYPDVYFKLIPMDIGDPEVKSRTISNYVKQEILTKEEARLLLEDEFFIEGGLE